MHPGAGRDRAQPEPHTQLDPALDAENCCVQLLHFLMANQPSALQKASPGGRRGSLLSVEPDCPQGALSCPHREGDQHGSGGDP